MRGQSEFIDFPNKFVVFKVANCLIAANTNPILNFIVSKKLTGPVGHALADQCETRYGDENGLRPKCLSDPKCGKAFSCTAGHDQSTARCLIASEMSLCCGDCGALVRLRASGLWSCASAL